MRLLVAWIDAPDPLTATISGLVRRATQPARCKAKEACTSRSAAKGRLLVERSGTLVLGRVVPTGGQMEPSAQLRAVPIGVQPVPASRRWLS